MVYNDDVIRPLEDPIYAEGTPRRCAAISRRTAATSIFGTGFGSPVGAPAFF
ncbi:hypothetical protein NP284_20670 [Rhodopseudomonas pseudopalustris]|uniref:hypothetical protein n=1 Tax=Rhodopseudomonas pseudopalustris TaxID=1513892 RepID=UPI003F95CA58